MVVIAENREQSSLGFQAAQRVAERVDVVVHRIRAGEVVSGQKDKVRMLAIDRLDGKMEPREVFVAVDVKIAYLAGDSAAMGFGESADRQVDSREVDLVDGLAPHAMQRPKRERWARFAPFGRLGRASALAD